jgi:hypothetical protein
VLIVFEVDYEANGLSKQVNAVQKEIAAKKKVVVDAHLLACLNL